MAKNRQWRKSTSFVDRSAASSRRTSPTSRLASSPTSRHHQRYRSVSLSSSLVFCPIADDVPLLLLPAQGPPPAHRCRLHRPGRSPQGHRGQGPRRGRGHAVHHRPRRALPRARHPRRGRLRAPLVRARGRPAARVRCLPRGRPHLARVRQRSVPRPLLTPYFPRLLERSHTCMCAGLTVVNGAWLSTLGKSLCTYSKPFKNKEGQSMVIPHFGPQGWELPPIKESSK